MSQKKLSDLNSIQSHLSYELMNITMMKVTDYVIVSRWDFSLLRREMIIFCSICWLMNMNEIFGYDFFGVGVYLTDLSAYIRDW